MLHVHVTWASQKKVGIGTCTFCGQSPQWSEPRCPYSQSAHTRDCASLLLPAPRQVIWWGPGLNQEAPAPQHTAQHSAFCAHLH